MKQTKNHKLNLVEMSDPFSTEPLNQNMETIDTALKAAGDATAAVSKRVVSLEARHIIFGSYTGNGSGKTITLEFSPKAVIIGGGNNTVIVKNVLSGGSTIGTLTDSGFYVSGPLCASGAAYNYVAFD